MSDTIIRAENIGKRYILSHLASGGSGGYQRFSESLAYWAKTPLRWLHKQKAESGKLKPGTQNTDGGNPSQLSNKEDFWALKDINFEIKQGEVVGIIGRNGAGKSTLLKILSRITEPTTGRIKLKGRVASLLEVGTGFHPELTGRENIFLNGAILGMHRHEIKAKFDEIVEFSEIEKFLDTPVKRYSSGMYVRLAFAVAAHLEPEILIVDEVLAVGDAQFQAKCLGKMKDVARGGDRTVLFVSHNMGAVRSLCSRGILMQKGRVQAVGSSDEMIDQYLSLGAPAAGSSFVPNTQAESYFEECLVVTAKEEPLCTGLTCESVTIILRYFNLRKHKSLRVGISLVSAEGNVIATCAPEDVGASTNGEPGKHEFAARIPENTLMKGSFTINAALWDQLEGVIHDNVRTIGSFQLEAGGGVYLHDPNRSGAVQLAMSWEARS